MAGVNSAHKMSDAERKRYAKIRIERLTAKLRRLESYDPRSIEVRKATRSTLVAIKRWEQILSNLE